MMKLNEFKEFLDAYWHCDDPDFDVEMRWDNSYDGSTKWHILREEDGAFRYGLFPFEAKYRMRKKG